MVEQINYWAVFVAAMSTFVVGSLWYSPVMFGKKWMQLNGFSEDSIKQARYPMPVIFGSSFVAALLAAFALALFLGSESDLTFGMFAGFMIAAFWIATSRLTTALFEQQKMALVLIHAGYDVVSYVVMGAIIGAW
ncbi:DUF1761 domain-containing protein [Mangrovibacterium marinum]|uniref:Uncharacterized protein DUF1761 n=1 Tax=Mangrovibacterium marinum TaxID=1639118 RepID=A0A2T5C1Y7_9BACT|nr:DUF1761 domain-containing protein [Mangrovibacterium marinum]PTN08712.1 uncharacterized protein DUF1761 [Mangrovibacterium marinum]